jgi:hypothetical protein
MTNLLEILDLELEDNWNKHLKKHDVVLPRKGSKQRCVIIALYANLGRSLTQDQIVGWMFENFELIYDRQGRHLAAKGWYIITGKARATNMEIGCDMKDGELKLVSVTEPNPIFIERLKQKRIMGMVGDDWEGKLEEFKIAGRGCAVCGRHLDSYDKGHLDPELPYTVENIVPMCVDCNNWAQRRNASFDFNQGTLVAKPKLPIPEPRRYEGHED